MFARCSHLGSVVLKFQGRFWAPLSGPVDCGFKVLANVFRTKERFILAERVGAGTDAPEPSIRVVENWYEEFRNREQDLSPLKRTT